MTSSATLYHVVDGTTGERYPTRPIDTANKNDKGWLLRTRFAYGKRTGHRLVLVPVEDVA